MHRRHTLVSFAALVMASGVLACTGDSTPATADPEGPADVDPAADATALLDVAVSDAEAPAELPPDPSDAEDPEPADAGPGPEDAPADGGPDPADAPSDEGPPGELPPLPSVDHPPDEWGPYAIGAREESFFDDEQGRLLSTMIWYPAIKASEPKAKYLFLIEGEALDEPSPAKADGPFPVVLFSHGFQGIHFQSYSITEYLASHGWVVIAPNHTGNTLFDSSASDEQVAQVAIARPKDMVYVLGATQALSDDSGSWLAGVVDSSTVVAMGHSFGGWTALILAGGVVDIDYGKAQCDAGTEADVFCPYIGFWPEGANIALDAPIPGLKAGVYYAPGGAAGFPEGALGTTVPNLIFGGTIDKMIPLETEVLPIWELLAPPKTKVEIQNASHMSFTNICSVPGAAGFMGDLCGAPGVIEDALAHHISRTLTVAFLGLHVKGQEGMAAWLDPATLAESMPEATLE